MSGIIGPSAACCNDNETQCTAAAAADHGNKDRQDHCSDYLESRYHTFVLQKHDEARVSCASEVLESYVKMSNI